LLVSSILKLFQAVFKTEVHFFIEIIRVDQLHCISMISVILNTKMHVSKWVDVHN